MNKNTYDLTNPQNSIWVTEEYYKGTPMENIAGSVIINEDVNFKLLTKAINLFAKNNSSFNLRFFKSENSVKQCLQDFKEFSIEIVNVESNKDVKKLEKELSNTPFDVLNSKLYSAKLFKFPDNHGGFVISIHHLIADAWTSGLIIDGIINIYSELLKNPEKTDFEFPSYLDYIESEQKYLNSEKFNKDKSFWNELYSNVPGIASIPSFSISDSTLNNTPKAKRKVFTLPEETFTLIDNFAKKYKASPFNFFMGVIAIYLSRVSNLNEFVIGTPILNRSNFKDKHTTGMFISNIPFKVAINKNISFHEFISNISSDFFDIFRHQKYPYQYLLEDLRKQNPSLPNLYDIAFSYQNTRTNSSNSEINFTSSWSTPDYIADSLDIHIFDLDDTKNLNIAYDYKISKYNIDDICSLHARILNIINQVLENEEILIDDIELVTPFEKEKLLYDFNNTALDYPKSKAIHELFESQVLRSPDNIALVFEDKILTYKELNEKANQLAHYLRNNNISKNSIVGIMVPRSLEMIVGILAILKSGACYLPIDPEYPADRISYMLENSKAKTLLTFKSLNSKLDFDNKIFIELNSDIYSGLKTNLLNETTPNDLAYVIYTSGSTGNPKGVMLKHHNVNNFIVGMKNIIKFTNKTIVSVTTISFDIFVLESLLPLQLGMKIVIANEKEQTDIKLFNSLCLKNKVNIIQTTPSRFKVLISNSNELDYLKNVTDILVGGESFPKSLLAELKSLVSCNIYNVYGPTETTVWSTVKDLTNTSTITIGKPIANTTCYVLDNNKNLLPIFTPGNLFIGGDGVSKGYFEKEDLTAEKFIANPYNEKEIIYNTGDLACYNSDGELIHLGRNDFQVKINGHRIELEEIENEMSKIKSIIDCVVIKKSLDDTHEFLCAYYTASQEIDISNIRISLQKALPFYMVPQYFIKLDKLPYTPNGKINRKQLPEPSITAVEKQVVGPRNNIDAELIKILSDLLNLDQISIDDSFFNLGGDSLSAINLCTQIYSKFNVQLFVKDILENPTIINLSDLISSKNTNIKIENSISTASKSTSYPTSSAQARTYYASSLAGNDSILYNISGGLILDKVPDISKLNLAFNKLINRQASLRTYFEIENEKVVQKIIDSIDFTLDYNSNITEQEESIDKIFNDFNTPFDLTKAPLFKAKLIKLNNKKSFLMVSMHHIISDGTSLSIFLDELCKFYNGEEPTSLKLDYKDYSIWENKNINSNLLKEAENFWVNQFNSEIPVLNMPTNPRPAVQSFVGNKIYANIDSETFSKISNLSKTLGVTPYMLLLSAYYILLYKYTAQDDIVVGTPIVNRNNADFYNIIGMFVNTLPIRSNIDSNLSVKDFINNIKKICLAAYKYQDYPFDELVAKLNIPRDTSRNPLFDTMFIYQNNGYGKANFNEIESQLYIPNTKISKFDLSLEIIPDNNTLDLSFEYSTKLFNKSFIENLSNHYINMVKNIISNYEIKIKDIDILSKNEKDKILYDFNNTKMNYPKDKTIQELFEEQVTKTPDNIALVFENKKLTYKELNEKANSLAHYLRSNGITRNDIVGIMVNRSLEMIVSILAVLKAGGCYVPIDPDYPQDRIEYMLNNSNSKFLLTFKSLDNQVNFANKIFVELSDKIYKNNKENLNNINSSEDLSYIIYTSGSTGKPKGVMLKHSSISNLTNYLNNYIEFLKPTKEPKVVVSVTTISFDIFIFETLICLQQGLKIIIANEEEQHIPEKLFALIQKNNVEILQMTPSRMQLFLDNINSKNLSPLKYIILAGEALPDSLLSRLLDLQINKVYNGYGPSETTIFSTFTDVTNYSCVTIGKPLDNTQVYILDKDMNICPINVPGELYISGDGVGLGYLNNNLLTQSSYLNNPFIENSIIYKTGDLCALQKNYEIQYLGRIDNQIKIHGLRIELSEIEKQILSYPYIKKACVIKQTIDNREFLSAYFTQEKRINISKLREHLTSSLPKYMVPSYFMVLDNFPYTPNGKINKKTLPLPKEFLNSNSKKDLVPPKTDIEKDFVRIWEDILNINPIGITDNFFELGGDSILAMNLNIELRKKYENINYQDIFKYPTISTLIKKITSKSKNYDFKYMEKNYTKYSPLFINNKVPSVFQLKYSNPGNILLTGATGFLGIHILDEFIKKEKGNIYCIVRSEPGLTAQAKLLQKLNYYFGNKYDNLLGKRIFAITGDVCIPGFGLNQEDLLNISNNISTVINTAARVSHYGNYSDFYNSNVKSVKNLIDFCKSFNKKIYHISTLSVSGNAFDSSIIKQELSDIKYFSENSLYIGQSLENVYIKTKFEAECLVLDAVLEGLDAYILRVGNLMPRLKDGFFQENISENAFINRILDFIKIGVVPDSILENYLEFTPIDIISTAILKLITHPNSSTKIFHLFNHNHIYINKCIKYFEILNPNLKIINEKDFENYIKTILNNKKQQNNLKLLINDLDKDLHLSYKSNIIVKSDYTIKYLSKLGFNWPKITDKYMIKFINLLRKVL